MRTADSNLSLISSKQSNIKISQVPKTQQDLREFYEYQKKKMRIAKIIDKRVENETRLLLKKQYRESLKVKNANGISSDVKMFMFRQK
jgi:hypothetical protein